MRIDCGMCEIWRGTSANKAARATCLLPCAPQLLQKKDNHELQSFLVINNYYPLLLRTVSGYYPDAKECSYGPTLISPYPIVGWVPKNCVRVLVPLHELPTWTRGATVCDVTTKTAPFAIVLVKPPKNKYKLPIRQKEGHRVSQLRSNRYTIMLA